MQSYAEVYRGMQSNTKLVTPLTLVIIVALLTHVVETHEPHEPH